MAAQTRPLMRSFTIFFAIGGGGTKSSSVLKSDTHLAVPFYQGFIFITVNINTGQAAGNITITVFFVKTNVLVETVVAICLSN